METPVSVHNAKLQREAAQFALDCTKAEYADLADAFKSLDGKAQGTVTLAGILVAAPFAFVKDTGGMSDAMKWLVSGTLIAALATIVCVLLALRIAELVMPLSGSDAKKVADDVTRDALPEGAEEASREQLMAGFLNEVQATWAASVEDLLAKALKKAAWVSYAQKLAALSAVFAAGAVAVRIWG